MGDEDESVYVTRNERMAEIVRSTRSAPPSAEELLARILPLMRLISYFDHEGNEHRAWGWSCGAETVSAWRVAVADLLDDEDD